MSLRRRIMGAFLIIILFTIVLSTGFEYWIASNRLNEFSTKIRTEDLAGVLSREYTTNKNWDNLEQTLIKYGVLFDYAKGQEFPNLKTDYYKQIPWRVVVTDVNGNITADSNTEITSDASLLQLEGEPVDINDLDTGQTVGAITIGIDRGFLITESRRFLVGALYPSLIQGLITAVIALLLGDWLSRRVTAPVTALTKAAEAIVQSGDTQLLPVTSSDELGQMSDSFNQMMTSLQTQRDLRKRLINDVSHEINTPLSVIRLEAQGLRDELKPPADAAEQIIGEVDRLSTLAHDLNWLAETDSGDLRLAMEPLLLGDLLTVEVERWQLKAQVAEVELSLLPLPPDLPTIQMDKKRINQAVANLIENALQHTPKGGHVTVECKVTNEGLETVVCDSGSGIAADDLPFVFERFYRADTSRQQATGGRGLGLAIVKQIMKAHQGEVWAESELGKGSRFYFRLPV